MSQVNRPDPIVKETEAKAAVDEIKKGLASTAVRQGKLPDSREIDRVAQEVTREQINRHQESYNRVIAKHEAKKKARESQRKQTADGGWEEKGVDALGEYTRFMKPFNPDEWNRRSVASIAERLVTFYANQRAQFLLATHRDDKGKHVPSHPYWYHRINEVIEQHQAAARQVGIPIHEAEKHMDKALTVVLDDSIAQFGEWNPIRAKAPHNNKITVSG